MENNTTAACGQDECTGWTHDPAMLGDFKHAIRAVAGKWKLEIMYELRNGAMRFGALRRSLTGITQHMLTMQLRELEQDGLVSRTAYAEKPLRVEYELTDAAYGLSAAFMELLSWSKLHGTGRVKLRVDENI